MFKHKKNSTRKPPAPFWVVLKLVGLFGLPILLLMLPANFFDEGQSICLSVLLLGKTCPGCGLTRSVMHIIHGEFVTGWEYNKVVVIVLPLGLYYYIKEAIKAVKEFKQLK